MALAVHLLDGSDANRILAARKACYYTTLDLL